MNNQEELKKRISSAKKELEAMERLLLEAEWTADKIFSGLRIRFTTGAGNGHHQMMIIQTGYNRDSYSVYGNRNDPFQPYSALQRVSSQEIADYLNKKNGKGMCRLVTDFKEDE